VVFAQVVPNPAWVSAHEVGRRSTGGCDGVGVVGRERPPDSRLRHRRALVRPHGRRRFLPRRRLQPRAPAKPSGAEHAGSSTSPAGSTQPASSDCAQALCHAGADDREAAVTPSLRAAMREAEEVEGLRLALTALRPVRLRVPAELDEVRLVRVQRQSELRQPFPQVAGPGSRWPGESAHSARPRGQVAWREGERTHCAMVHAGFRKHRDPPVTVALACRSELPLLWRTLS